MENINLKALFLELVSGYSADKSLAAMLWDEIAKAYSRPKRHYHTLAHLENLYRQLLDCKPLIGDWNTVLFSLYYHDIVYNASKGDNEEKSAELAEERMQSLGIPRSAIERCVDQILATKSHNLSADQDTNLFTDADLSILGMDWELYKAYFEHVRKEYRIYPDLLYRPGRKKVLKHFLDMERIFKTDFFFEKLEKQARHNLQREMDLL